MQRFIVGVLVLLIWLMASPAEATVDYLPVWQAFQLEIVPQTHQQLWLNFKIAPEYHVYQNKIKVEALADSQVQLGTPLWPEPVQLHSPDLGTFLVYENLTKIQIPIVTYGNGYLHLQVKYQGCKGLELCFPEQSQQFSLNLNSTLPLLANPTTAPAPLAKAKSSQLSPPTLAQLWPALFNGNLSQGMVASFFQARPGLVILIFFSFGLLIAFTPCVFPLLPILIGIISASGGSWRRNFSLALSYIVGGAVVYMLGGILAARIGYSLATMFQQTWLSYLLAALFAGLGLVLAGIINLQLPSSWQLRLNQQLARHNHATLAGTFMLGALSNLILSPCVTAPVAGALIFISTTGNHVLGGAALFALGLGSGTPLLLIAVFGKQLLPKSGVWLSKIKQLLALLMAAMAVYMLTKVDQGWLRSTSLTVLIALSLAWMLSLISWRWFIANLQPCFARYWSNRLGNGLLMLGALAMSAPLSWYLGIWHSQDRWSTKFVAVTNPQQLEQELRQARREHKAVMLDFYAQWCVACQEMDSRTFANQQVRDLLQHYHLVRVDVTANDQNSQALQQQYQVLAPPSLVFVAKNGQVQPQYQITGFIASHELSTSLARFNQQQLPLGCAPQNSNC